VKSRLAKIVGEQPILFLANVLPAKGGNPRGQCGRGLKPRARMRNTHRAALVAFANWCVETNPLTANPPARLSKADECGDCRRKRRALTEDRRKRPHD